MATDSGTLEVKIWRGDDTGGGYVTYGVPSQESQTVLDVVTWVQRNLEPGLAYRYACRVGMCGSCGMVVNGKPRWTCRTHVDNVSEGGALTIEPMKNMPVIRDLAVNMDVFFDKWVAAEGRFHPTSSREQDVERISPKDSNRLAASAGIECINCGVCYAACDVVSSNDDYLGPAALNRAWTLVNDERDGAQDTRLKAVSGDGGCTSCHSQQGCASHCPNFLNPTRSIAGLKRTVSLAALKGEL